MSSAGDPCVEAGTALCNELEECLLDVIIPPPRTEGQTSDRIEKLHGIVERLYSLLHYHVVATSGRSQCLQVEGILYRHLQLVSCRVVAAFIREKEASKSIGSSDRSALLGSLDSSLSGTGVSAPPVAALTSWLAALLPDIDNIRCFAPVAAPVLTPAVSSTQLPQQLRRLLHECVSGTSLPSNLSSTNPSSAFYSHASVAGSNGVTETARRYAIPTLRPFSLQAPVAAVAPAQQAPKPATPSASTARGRGNAPLTSPTVAAPPAIPSSTPLTSTSGVPDTTYIYIPRLSLPTYFSSLFPSRDGHAATVVPTANSCGSSVVAPAAMLVPSFYKDYKDRVAADVGEAAYAPPRQQQVLFELSKDQKLEQAAAAVGHTNTNQNHIDLAAYQRHWRRSDPFQAVKEAAARHEDEIYAAEEAQERFQDVGPITNEAASDRLASKRSRDVDSTFKFLVSNQWLDSTLSDMQSLSEFSRADGSTGLSTIVEGFLKDGSGSDIATLIEKARANVPIASCRDTEKVVRLSRSLLFTPALVRPALGITTNGTDSRSHLWALDRLYFSRRGVEGDALLPLELRSIMPSIYKPVAEDDMFKEIAVKELPTETEPIGEGDDDVDAEGGRDEMDLNGPLAADARAEDEGQHLGLHQRLSLLERIGVEFGVRQQLLQ